MITAEEATRFGRRSLTNAMVLRHLLKCGCSPYEDIFTFHRWKAQGFYVRRGEHGIQLPLVKEVEAEDRDGEVTEVKRVFGTSVVFCRCQVAKAERREKDDTSNSNSQTNQD